MAMLDDGRQLYFSWLLEDAGGRFTHALGSGGRRYATATQVLAALLIVVLIALTAQLAAAWGSHRLRELQGVALAAMFVAMAVLVVVGLTTASIQWRRPSRGPRPPGLTVVRWPSIAFQAVWATSFAIMALGLFTLMQDEPSSDPIADAMEAVLVALSLFFAVRIRSVWKASRE